MTKDEARTNRDNWRKTKADYEEKISRLETAKTNYLNILENGSWNTLLNDFDKFKNEVDPSFQAVDWEGKRVSNYRDRLDGLAGSLNQEGSKHYDVISQMESQIQIYETNVEDAQDHIDYWQDVIDNWDDEED